MCIEDFLKSLELPKKYYDSNFDSKRPIRGCIEISGCCM